MGSREQRAVKRLLLLLLLLLLLPVISSEIEPSEFCGIGALPLTTNLFAIAKFRVMIKPWFRVTIKLF